MPTVRCNDANLSFDDIGSGDETYVLLHGGAFCDRRFMAPLAQHFATRGRVVSVDLRGHGESERIGPISNVQFADDAAALCDALGLLGPVIIGHSTGAHAALEVAARHPGCARAIVLLDPGPLAWPPEKAEQNRGLAKMLRSTSGPQVLLAVAASMLPESEPFASRDALMSHASAADPTVFADLIESDLAWDGVGALGACPATTPLLVVVADKPLLDLDEFAELCPHALVGRTVGSHHFHHLVVPDQVIAMIDRFLVVTA